jgi:large subunit ribosomal protein L7/L12
MKSKAIFKDLTFLSLLDSRSITINLEDTFGVSSANLPVLGAISQVVSHEIVEEKTAFDVFLVEIPSDNKLSVLKLVRTITSLGLKESKEIVDNIPKLIKEGVTKEESESIKKDLEAVGAKVKIT